MTPVRHRGFRQALSPFAAAAREAVHEVVRRIQRAAKAGVDLVVPADLVVLSACETAAGKLYRAEGIVGLTRAFMVAGASRVLCSLWKVDDAATRAFMGKFYELWKDEGLPAATALRRAQDHLRAQKQWEHPAHWAAWVLWGLPD